MFSMPNGDMKTTKMKHILEEPFSLFKSCSSNSQESSSRIPQSMLFAMEPNWWSQVSSAMITTSMSELRSSLCQLREKPLQLLFLKWQPPKSDPAITESLPRPRESLWIVRHIPVNGRKAHMLVVNKSWSSSASCKRTVNPIPVLLKIGSNTITTRQTTTSCNDDWDININY